MIKAFGGSHRRSNAASPIPQENVVTTTSTKSGRETSATPPPQGNNSAATTTTTPGKSFRCPDCGSKSVETDENGQVTCLGCGYVIVVAQVVEEVQEIHDAVTFSLRNIRTGARKQRGKTTAQRELEKQQARDQVDLLNLEKACEMCQKYCQCLRILGFTQLDTDKAVSQVTDHFQERKEKSLSARKITGKVLGIVLANMNEVAVTAWDLSHLANSRILPILEYGCQERGPGPDHLMESKEQVESTYDLDLRAVALRFSFRLSRLLGIASETLWRASWLVLFGLGGSQAAKDMDAARIAAGVVGSVVLCKYWVRKCNSVTRNIAFSFCPYGTFFTNDRLLTDMESELRLRNEQYERQTIALNALEKKPTLDANLKHIFARKCPSDENPATSTVTATSTAAEQSANCNGRCCDGMIHLIENSAHRTVSHEAVLNFDSLKVWEKKLDSRDESEELQALITLVQLGERGIDSYVARSKVENGRRERFGLLTEIRRVVREASQLIAHSDFAEFHEDTRRLVGMGCQALLCCRRDPNSSMNRATPSSSPATVASATSSSAPPAVEPKPCGKCDNCKRTANCGECVHCKDKKEFGGLGKRRRVCKLRTCLEVHEYRRKRTYEYQKQYESVKKARKLGTLL